MTADTEAIFALKSHKEKLEKHLSGVTRRLTNLKNQKSKLVEKISDIQAQIQTLERQPQKKLVAVPAGLHGPVEMEINLPWQT